MVTNCLLMILACICVETSGLKCPCAQKWPHVILLCNYWYIGFYLAFEKPTYVPNSTTLVIHDLGTDISFNSSGG